MPLKSCSLCRTTTAPKNVLQSTVCRILGFTLIELAVVLLLLTIIFSMIGLNLGGDDRADVRQEAERLALLLHTAQEEAILQGQVFALTLETGGYHFLQLSSEGTLKPLTRDDVLRPRELPAGMSISTVEVDGQVDEKTSGIVLAPSGELPAFNITFTKGTVHWQVKGSIADGIRSTAPSESRATS